ncbi:MAG TPA: hypothetical protein K8W01_18480 [Methylorubrum populi]|uniref:Uncharacterized protein n=1 Tax=Methylorubrum populi TaxID=223967 RepID=A0A921E561_9HYPH|nr:hypothetical protein [Methylorubrum populi]
MKAMWAAALMLISATEVSAKDRYSDYQDYFLSTAPNVKSAPKKFQNSKSFLDEHLATVRTGDCDVAKPNHRFTGGHRTSSGGWVMPSYTTNPGIAPPAGEGVPSMPGGAVQGWNEVNPYVGGLGNRR